MPLTEEEKELVAISISIAAGCRPCTDYHIDKCRQIGTAETAIEKAIALAISQREEAAALMRQYALSKIGSDASLPAPQVPSNRMTALIAIGAVHGVNCTASLETNLTSSKHTGVTNDDLAEVQKLAHFIKTKAASHVEKMFELDGNVLQTEKNEAHQADIENCCG